MEQIPARELRNHTAAALRRVEDGGSLIITVNGRPAAQLVPLSEKRRRSWISRRELMTRLQSVQADPGMRRDLERLAGETTDDLGPVR